ncbi:DUF871 domain-containing protein [Bacillus sinesaloumensis]|uniref:DUF871 domain-containing protein n=1 Tax=Litchfieldia sinesaloumensis TaxID=1926280 RepID=UPI0009886E1F|nr:MupG family TIM beta-alpha barrel fold protein [Bacillus sinesaloumensis]
MLGISMYLNEEITEQRELYIKKMSEIGFKSIFTSLHIPEDDPSLYTDRLKVLGSLARKYNMELFADISPKSLQYLGYTWENAEYLQDWGLSGVRVDYGVSEEVIANLSKKMKIALNASTLTIEGISKLKEYGIQLSSVEAWHNFYPRPETGLDLEEFNLRNQWLKAEGIKVMAFIPGDGEKRGPLFKGLPTIEDHRELSAFAAYLDFLKNPFVDKVLIGDPTISEWSEKQFESLKEGVIELRAKSVTTDKKILERINCVLSNRQDAARDVIRAAESRLYGLIGDFPVKAENTVERPTGSITVDNSDYGRYQGEVQITKRNLPIDTKVNVIGKVIDEDLPLLANISGGTKFRLHWVED